MINQLHVTSDLVIARGGQQKASFNLAYTLADLGGKVGLWFGKGTSRSYADDVQEDAALQMFSFEGTSGILFEGECSRFLSFAMESVSADVVHIHGMWLPVFRSAVKVAKSKRLVVVISPHGTLTAWDLNKKKWKKRLAMFLYQKAILKSADMFFATSVAEAEGIRALGLKQPIAIIPVGVDIPDIENSLIPKATEERVLLYMGRIHPGKGVLDLIEAWRRVKKPNWRLKIAGPAVSADEIAYRHLVEQKISENFLGGEIEFLGMIEGAAKRSAFETAKLFVLPSYSENFGIVVAEALAYGLPVITTTGAPWRELVEHDCGWWVSPGVEGLCDALSSAMDKSSGELSEMGRRGRELVIDKYSWSDAGKSSLDAYEWLLGRRGLKPSCIFD